MLEKTDKTHQREFFRVLFSKGFHTISDENCFLRIDYVYFYRFSTAREFDKHPH
jgi:hypothetical protein